MTANIDDIGSARTRVEYLRKSEYEHAHSSGGKELVRSFPGLSPVNLVEIGLTWIIFKRPSQRSTPSY